MLQIEAGGDLFAAFDQGETNVGEMIGLLAAALILLVVFGSFIAMSLPIGMAIFSLAVGISSMGLLAHFLAVPSWAPVLASMVGLGVGIDYALFILTRHRAGLAAGRSVDEAAGWALETSGKAVVFAGGTVVVAILGLAVAIFVDATLVRMILVPATMSLLGNANWWLPRWLDRLLPSLDGGRVEGRPARELHGGPLADSSV